MVLVTGLREELGEGLHARAALGQRAFPERFRISERIQILLRAPREFSGDGLVDDADVR